MERRLVQILFLLILAFGFVCPGRVFAESIQNFDVHVTAHKNGSMSIEEIIQYDFGGTSKHGIYRVIPLVSQVGSNLQRMIAIDVSTVERDGLQEQFDETSSNQNLQIKIGDPNQTITGLHTYTIDYVVQNGIGSNYSDHDEIYWNVTGNAWEVPIQEASVTLKTDFGVLPGATICYTGETGSRVSSCLVSDITDGKRVTTTSTLSLHEGLSVVSSFPVGTFPKSILQPLQHSASLDPATIITLLRIIVSVYIVLNLGIGPGLLFWYLHKRKKKFGPPVVNFDMPKDGKGQRISPAEAGTIDNAKLDKDDLTGTIFDLAIRKYIRIEQVKKKREIWDFREKVDYQLVKLKSFEELNPFEKRLTKVVFAREEKTLISGVKVAFADFDDLETMNFASLMHRGFYSKNPEGQMAVLLGLGIFFTITLNLVFGPVLIYLSRKLNGRTALGEEIDWKINGLKRFLKNMDRYYKWQAEKAYVVEQMIPYAMSLGYIDTYMKQVKLLQPDYQPTWYVGQTPFWLVYPGFSTSFNNTVMTSAPSSSSGFSSGGFSGGGGGGGGGGSW